MKAGLPPTLTPTQRGQTGKHIWLGQTHTLSLSLSLIPTHAQWDLDVHGNRNTCAHTRGRVQIVSHIYTHTIYAYAKWNGTIFLSRAVSCYGPSSSVALCLCVYFSWRTMKRFAPVRWDVTEQREGERERGNKLNGVRTKKEKDWEERLREQVYMLCCCSARFFYFFHDEFIWHERQQSAPCIEH